MNFNTVSIFGNLTRDPELKSMPSGKNICKLSIANNRVYTKNNEKVTEVSYFDVDVWGVVADNCAKYLKKGTGVIVEGRLKQDRWEKDGKTQSRVTISANSVHFMPRKSGDGAGQESRAESSAVAQGQTAEYNSPDNIVWEE